MATPDAPVRVAAVQATPVFLDRDATVDKACELIAEAARNGAALVAFPEAFVPAYPDWVWVVPPADSSTLYALYGELLANSVTIPSAATDKLCRTARKAKTYVVIGINERNAEASGGSLYNTLLYIGADGRILGKHRKLVPTGAERLVWAQGDGSTLEVYETPFGKLGGLICWENYMPLARYAMYAWGTQVYVAATWDHGEPWLSTLRHIAKEGRMYVIGVCMPLRAADIPDQYEFKRYYGGRDWINPGESAIAGPDGNFIAGPVREIEQILYADLDLQRLANSKWMLDVAGHYARPDVFQLTVHTAPRPVMTLDGAGELAVPRQPPAAQKRRARRV
ncbi:MAG: carbon-nitrogen hydrolase family protein [Dehalococcoidia bacterium]|nr:carbon-nitrogen hydrolase family protein [Dehalococcoidia bacterium]